ncbi:MAG UNVERIFIED_CONTAM: hypothetical protein LOD86_04440 [Thermobifida fusca]
MTESELLRQAAARLRATAAATQPSPSTLSAWPPELARALADWIGSWQWQTPGEDAPEDYQHAVRIARLVLGKEKTE